MLIYLMGIIVVICIVKIINQNKQIKNENSEGKEIQLNTTIIENTEENKKRETEIEVKDNRKHIDLSKFTTTNYVMTRNELIFYRELKKITDKLDLTIFPQVDMERFIKVIDRNTADRNRIKSCSVDFVIVNNINCKIVCCIELDDSSHNRANVKIKDNFRNELFEHVNIPLFRIKNNYQFYLADIEEKIAKCI